LFISLLLNISFRPHAQMLFFSLLSPQACSRAPMCYFGIPTCYLSGIAKSSWRASLVLLYALSMFRCCCMYIPMSFYSVDTPKALEKVAGLVFRDERFERLAAFVSAYRCNLSGDIQIRLRLSRGRLILRYSYTIVPVCLLAEKSVRIGMAIELA